VLSLPERATNALSASQIIERVAPLAWEEREKELLAQVASGNVPSFLRKLCPVSITNVIEGRTNQATFWVTPDYVAVGADDDFFLTPLSPKSAQALADSLGCTLPTRKIVDAIYTAAPLKLAPAPIPPSPAMTSVLIFSNHNALVRAQREAALASRRLPLGTLVAGHKKDVVISPKLAALPGKVAIYGWHQTNGVPIQSLYLGHTDTWVDYSQCSRLVQEQMTVNGHAKMVSEILADPKQASLLSDDGVIAEPRYTALPVTPTPPSPRRSEAEIAPQNSEAKSDAHPAPPLLASEPDETGGASGGKAVPLEAGATWPSVSRKSGAFNERIASFTFEPEIHIHVNAPGSTALKPGNKVLLIFFALPNGNTTAQTIGKVLEPGDDWHYDIQHIGAQTRFLRALIPDRTIVVAYLEAEQKSWPAWRKKHGDKLLPEIVTRVAGLFAGQEIELALASHSGGGSFIFGFLTPRVLTPSSRTLARRTAASDSSSRKIPNGKFFTRRR